MAASDWQQNWLCPKLPHGADRENINNNKYFYRTKNFDNQRKVDDKIYEEEKNIYRDYMIGRGGVCQNANTIIITQPIASPYN